MAEALRHALASPDLDERLEGVSKLREADPASLPDLFDIILEHPHAAVRIAAAELVTLCPSIYVKFLSDLTPAVRISIIERSVEIRALLPNSEQVLADLSSLVADPVVSVRCALAVALRAHTTVDVPENPEAAFLSNIAPIILALLGDTNDDVRIAASINLGDLVGVFEFDFIFVQLYEQIRSILTDMQWRVRRHGYRLLCCLSLVCSARYFNLNIMPFVVKALCDNSSQIRLFAISQLPFLVQQFREQWLMESLVPRLQELNTPSNFLWRQTYLLSLIALIDWFQPERRSQFVFQPIIRALRDPVASVVLLAIDLLSTHITEIHPFRRSAEIKPILENIFVDASQTIVEKANALLSSCE
jgi:hypothetical protein